ncbi:MULTISPECIES: hypothetical protein [unclassified Synechocystis]|nr:MULTISPECIES: hypothetical protein [unclassified Synechocystis]AIE74656.1 hypothetical protein D082_21280 [Synechocystis sp. PCC 6714]MCT0253988.1 hypothetical protein [Synechocystis sp. CS-94]
MADTVIWVESLGKKYVIGHQQQKRDTALRDVLKKKFSAWKTNKGVKLYE